MILWLTGQPGSGKTTLAKAFIEKELEDLISLNRVKVIIIPDIESVNYGRGVGYDIIEHVPPQEVGEISATEIRKKLFNK